ncbi:hypothetical protein HDU93_001190 [Gonapodya sp. JEL0774]|nr:hypothetical protein HDU93_001190 [Gonapodya sp. JEL0774]
MSQEETEPSHGTLDDLTFNDSLPMAITQEHGLEDKSESPTYFDFMMAEYERLTQAQLFELTLSNWAMLTALQYQGGQQWNPMNPPLITEASTKTPTAAPRQSLPATRYPSPPPSPLRPSSPAPVTSIPLANTTANILSMNDLHQLLALTSPTTGHSHDVGIHGWDPLLMRMATCMGPPVVMECGAGHLPECEYLPYNGCEQGQNWLRGVELIRGESWDF